MRRGARPRLEYWIAAAALTLVVACVPVSDTPPLPPLDPSATFAAHRVHGGLAIDRLEGVAPGRLEADVGKFVLREGDAPVAALWLTAPATVVARAGPTSAAPACRRSRGRGRPTSTRAGRTGPR